MATGNYPFQSQSREQLKQLILLGELNLEQYGIDPDFQYLIKRITTINTKLRPTAKELLQLPKFNTVSKQLHAYNYINN